jgi:hypothetical protein
MATALAEQRIEKTMKNRINKDQWVSMFQELGLNDAAMHRWHRTFESRHPEAHQSFLEWLGIGAEETVQIRQHSR